MRWKSGRRSTNIDDRRGRRVVGKKTAGGGVAVLLLALVAMYFGIDPGVILQSGLVDTGQSTVRVERPAAEDQLADFVAVVLADTEDTWEPLFAEAGRTYERPVLVLFTDAVQSACGNATAAVGPFYCPADHRLYIDLSFYRDLKEKLGAPGDFAQAYVIAHEVGHHVQNLLGISRQVQTMRSRLTELEYNKLSVKMELQADCFSGIWAHYADRLRALVEPGDIEEALNAAAMIGDDRLQKRSRGYVTPDSFTHGSSAQRVHWFKRGYASGDMAECNTFAQGG